MSNFSFKICHQENKKSNNLVTLVVLSFVYSLLSSPTHFISHDLYYNRFPYLLTSLPTYIHTYLHTCLHTYLHNYLHTYLHTYLPINVGLIVQFSFHVPYLLFFANCLIRERTLYSEFNAFLNFKVSFIVFPIRD